MSVQLPIPLDYDYVDEYIDTNTRFVDNESEYYGEKVIVHNAYPRTQVHNPSFRQPAWKWKYDAYEDYYSEEEGYVTWYGGAGTMDWTADWTEEDTENWLDEFFVESHRFILD